MSTTEYDNKESEVSPDNPSALNEQRAKEELSYGADNYILVAEDRSRVSYGDDVGNMQIVRSIANDGSINGMSVSDLTDDTAQAVPKFEKEPSSQSVKTGKSGKPRPTIDKDCDIPLLEPFLCSFIRFAKNGNYRLWLVPVLSQGVKGISVGIDNLRQALSDPKNHGEYIKDSRVRPQDYLEAPTVTDGLEVKLASLGLSKQILEERRQPENFLSFKPMDLLPVHIRTGDIDIRTEGRLTLRTQPDGSESISVRCVREELNLEALYMCCSFTDQDKEGLLKAGHLGRVAQLKGADGRESSVYISVDEDTNTLVYIPTARVYIPQTISGVDLSPDQRATLQAGKPLPFPGVSAKGKEYTTTIQVDTRKRAMLFTFPPTDVKQVLDTRRTDGVPIMISGQVLTKETQDKLAKGETFYLEGLKNSRTKKSFNSYVSYDASTQRVRYSKYDPTDLTKQAQEREMRLIPNDKDAPEQNQSREQSKGRKAQTSYIMEESILLPFPSDYDEELKVLSLDPNTEVAVIYSSPNLNLNCFDAREMIARLPRLLPKSETPEGVGEVRINNKSRDKLLHSISSYETGFQKAYIKAIPYVVPLIKPSLLLEEHRDRKKVEGNNRIATSPSDPVIEKVQRLYGCLFISSTLYRVKTTIQVLRLENMIDKYRGYDITEIELLGSKPRTITVSGNHVALLSSSIEEMLNPKTATPIEGRLQPLNSNSISLTKLLKGVELSYKPNIKLLDAM